MHERDVVCGAFRCSDLHIRNFRGTPKKIIILKAQASRRKSIELKKRHRFMYVSDTNTMASSFLNIINGVIKTTINV